MPIGTELLGEGGALVVRDYSELIYYYLSRVVLAAFAFRMDTVVSAFTRIGVVIASSIV